MSSVHLTHSLDKTSLQIPTSTWYAGIDEAGRGAWAGPLCVGMVIRHRDQLFLSISPEINDSKQLKANRRTELSRLIRITSTWWDRQWASPIDIDAGNINISTKDSINQMLDRVPNKIARDLTLLIDGNFNFSFSLPTRYIIKGDEKITLISEASILAKERRDLLMSRMQLYYPRFNFSQHKGYGTKLHKEELQKYGPQRIHRKSYRPVQELMQGVG